MKSPLLGLLCAAAILSAAGEIRAEDYILAKKAPPALVGSKVSKEHASEFKGGKISYSQGDQKAEGTFENKDVVLSSTECLSPTRFRYLESKAEVTRRSVVNGKEAKDAQPQGPLVGVPVMLEIKDGRCTASMEKGDSTEEQEAQLGALERKYSPGNDLAMFGEVPRKPGDKWEVDVTKLYLEYTDTNVGTMTVEFVEVKEIEGVRCAVLKSVFNLRGTVTEDGVESAVLLQGQEIIHRSLADLITLEAKLTGSIVLMTHMDETSVQISSPLIGSERAKLAKPKR